jgi:hypothetical protein
MKTIWRYIVDPGEVTLMLPRGGKIVHFGYKNPNLCIWYEFDPYEKHNLKPFHINIVPTGGEFYEFNNKHIGTAVCGDFVWHLYSDLY